MFLFFIDSQPLSCSNSIVCQNGGTCVNKAVNSTELFGFQCNCAPGFDGDFCEKSKLLRKI